MGGSSGPGAAAVLGIHYTTLYRRVEEEKGMFFTEYAAEKKAKGDELLRNKQFDKAMTGDNVMLVWLGKNRLGQRDKTPEEQPEIKLDRLLGVLESVVAMKKEVQADAQKPALEQQKCPPANDLVANGQSAAEEIKTDSVLDDATQR